jgi:hypothetical protein
MDILSLSLSGRPGLVHYTFCSLNPGVRLPSMGYYITITAIYSASSSKRTAKNLDLAQVLREQMLTKAYPRTCSSAEA